MKLILPLTRCTTTRREPGALIPSILSLNPLPSPMRMTTILLFWLSSLWLVTALWFSMRLLVSIPFLSVHSLEDMELSLTSDSIYNYLTKSLTLSFTQQLIESCRNKFNTFCTYLIHLDNKQTRMSSSSLLESRHWSHSWALLAVQVRQPLCLYSWSLHEGLQWGYFRYWQHQLRLHH